MDLREQVGPPDIQPQGGVPPAASDAPQRTMGSRVNRRMAERCSAELRGAIRLKGLDAAKAAFEHLGRIAMMALMAHPELSASVSGLERYLDAARVGRAMEFD